MEFKHSKHVTVNCSLTIGQKVKIEGWGYKFDGKELEIEDIRYAPEKCQTSVQVKIKEYEGYIDSDWITIL